jgi:uncharacterized repeat protein (TIGR04076 family)
MDYEKAFNRYKKDISFITKEEFDGMRQSYKEGVINLGKMEHDKKRLIATVIKSKGACLAKYEEGDRLVFNILGMFLPGESSVKVACSWLLGDLVPIFASNEGLLFNGVVLKEPFYDIVECSDPGPPAGWGHITVKLHIE